MAICGGSGTVPQTTVLDVLRSHQVSVHDVVVNDADGVILSGVGVVEVQMLPEPVSRRLIQRLSAKFRIPIEFFYHPEKTH